MSKICAECGTDLSALTGAVEESDTKIELLRDWEVDVPAPICAACFGKILDSAQARLGPSFTFPDEPPADFRAKALERRRAIEIVTGPPLGPGPFVNLGLVTGHAVVGTGPLTSLASGLTDIIGGRSKIHGEKLDLAETICLDEIKSKAVRKGATLIANLQTSWSELTAGHGMLLVAMVGTALKPAGQKEPGRS